MKIPSAIRRRRSYLRDIQNTFSPKDLKEELEQVFCELNEKRNPKEMKGKC